MATVVSAGADTNVPARKQDKAVYCVRDTIEPTAAAQNDIYYVAKVPNGVTVVDGKVEYDALGANTAIKVGLYSDTAGTAVDDDRLVASTATTSAGTTQFNGGASLNCRNSSGADYYLGVKMNDSGTHAGTIRVTAFLNAET